jgi:methionine-S-sulfoxide reductase
MLKYKFSVCVGVVLLGVVSVSVLLDEPLHAADDQKKQEESMNSVVFGAGCFWCVEAAFRLVDGVVDVVVGYTGGHVKNPSYKAVCTGQTGHAEVAKVTYDESKVSLDALMEIFLVIHDPTQLNGQGADKGTQYRSAVFVNSDAQRDVVKKLLKKAQSEYARPIVTEVSVLGEFYKAEDYHQQYFEKNPNAGYCQVVIAPKIMKVKRALDR